MGLLQTVTVLILHMEGVEMQEFEVFHPEPLNYCILNYRRRMTGTQWRFSCLTDDGDTVYFTVTGRLYV